MTNHDKDVALQWLEVRDERLDWLNVADWEPRDGGLQPVRVPKFWRDQWPARTARRGMSAAGVTLRLRTDSKKLVLSVTFIDSPDAPDNAAVAWERSRPSFFSLYRDGKYVSSVAALTQWTRQDVTIYDDPQISGEAEIQVLFPFYYRNAEIIVHAIGIEPQAALRRPRRTTAREFYFTATRSRTATASPARAKLTSGKSRRNSAVCRSIMALAAARGRTTSSHRRSRAGATGTCSRL